MVQSIRLEHVSDACYSDRMTLHKRMKDPRFRQEQWDRRYDPHIAPINRLVDDLQREADVRMPYVAPHYGGINAEVLFIFETPGPKTDEQRGGSGFICAENDDDSAQRFAECLDDAGLAIGRVVSWNASPWTRESDKSVSAGELDAGVEPIMRLLALLQQLKVVMLMGKKARDGWNRLCVKHPHLQNRYQVLSTYHTSNRGITNGSQLPNKNEGIAAVITAMRKALEIIESSRNV